MRWRLRQKFLLLGAAIGLAALSGPPSMAQVVCANCATEITQLLNYAQLIDQLAKQGSILTTSTNQYSLMTRNSTPLPSQQWGTGQSDLNSVTAILARATSLSIALSNLDSQFGQKYSNYNNYVNGAQGTLNSQTFASKYQQWSSDTNSSIQTTLDAARLQSSQIAGSEGQTLQTLQGHAQSAAGYLGTMQTGNEIAMQVVLQLQKLRQIALMDLQMKANFIQSQSDQGISSQAAWKKFTTVPQIQTSGGTRF
jgi:P-type conjugative transfer protein TrbJ